MRANGKITLNISGAKAGLPLNLSHVQLSRNLANNFCNFFEQGLGGDATPVEADPAQPLALDDCSLQAKLCGADRRHITPGSGTENDEVIGISQG